MAVHAGTGEKTMITTRVQFEPLSSRPDKSRNRGESALLRQSVVASR
jgi:hypothetical protein